jgi:hypothetical protein
MSRSTQYIGLTAKAEEFMKQFEEIQHPNSTSGMFGEEVPLRVWQGIWLGSGKKATIYETEQVTPWSSGPMIFTDLLIVLDNGCKFSHVYSWVQDPMETNEYDKEKGVFWV